MNTMLCASVIHEIGFVLEAPKHAHTGRRPRTNSDAISALNPINMTSDAIVQSLELPLCRQHQLFSLPFVHSHLRQPKKPCHLR